MRIEKKLKLERRRRGSNRKKVIGTPERPRMSVRFTNRNIHVQFIDDLAGRTVAATGTISKKVPQKGTLAANVESAKKIGEQAADLALQQGIKKVVFDRSGARYHGKVKALADAAREKGLEF
jgi:large subunit ribosomal protein L18